MSELENKRGKLREQIRKRQIETLFENKRKEVLGFHRNKGLDDFNHDLLKKSLQKNMVSSEISIQTLLSKLYTMIKQKPTQPNKEYVIALCSNIYGDDINPHHKQLIYDLCTFEMLREVRAQVEVYYYKNLVLYGYECLDESVNESIADHVLPRLIQLLRQPQFMKSRYFIQQVIMQILQTLQSYFCIDKDHNISLPYKHKRNYPILQSLIQWNMQFEIGTDIQIINHVLRIYLNLSSVSQFCKPLTTLSFNNFIKIIKQSASIANKNHHTDELVLNIIKNVMEDNPDYEIFNQPQVIALVQSIEEYITFNLNELFLKLHLIKHYIQYKTQKMRALFFKVLSNVLNVLNHSYTDVSQILETCLKIIKIIFELTFNEGNDEYIIYFKGLGGQKALESINFQKNTLIDQLIESLYQTLDLIS